MHWLRRAATGDAGSPFRDDFEAGLVAVLEGARLGFFPVSTNGKGKSSGASWVWTFGPDVSAG